MTNPMNYPIYPCKSLCSALFIIGLCLLNFPSMEAGLYPEGAFDFTTMATDRTVEATHIIVGVVTDVSFVFYREYCAPCSLVTVRVAKDMKAEVERAANRETDLLGGQASSEDRETPPKTVTFVQEGGPRLDDGIIVQWVTVVGVRVLKKGDYVFLMLLPVNKPFEHNGHSINSATHEYGTMFSVREDGAEVDKHILKKFLSTLSRIKARADGLDKHIIEEGWSRMDVTVLQMARIVRATLKQPERMRTLERRVHGLKKRMPRMPIVRDVNGRLRRKQPRGLLKAVMDEVTTIEAELNLPPLCRSDGVKDD